MSEKKLAARKAFELTMTLRNNLLKSRREALGLSRSALAKLIGVGISDYGRLEALKQRPTRMPTERHPELRWLAIAQRIANFYNVLPENLWPDEILEVQKVEAVKTFDLDDLHPLLSDHQALMLESPEDILIQREFELDVSRALEKIKPREREVLRGRFGFDSEERTQADIGKDYGVQRTRINQIEALALRKLRHPANGNLVQFATPPMLQCGVGCAPMFPDGHDNTGVFLGWWDGYDCWAETGDAPGLSLIGGWGRGHQVSCFLLNGKRPLVEQKDWVDAALRICRDRGLFKDELAYGPYGAPREGGS